MSPIDWQSMHTCPRNIEVLFWYPKKMHGPTGRDVLAPMFRTGKLGDTPRQPSAWAHLAPPRSCKYCGCTEHDCTACVEKIGMRCHWVDEDICSACLDKWQEEELAKQKKKRRGRTQ